MSNIENLPNLCHNLYMFVIECLPFSKGLKKDSLSYFSAQSLELGSLIKINVRGKNLNALIIGSRDVAEIKAEIKAANFQLKKISAVVAKPFLQKEFLEAVKITADYFVTNQGNLLPHLIPSFILENKPPTIIPKTSGNNTLKDIGNKNKTKSDIAVLQVPDEERFIHYRSLIREEFAKKKSVFLCLPQNEDVKQAKEKLERGIEKFVYAFHKNMDKNSKKEWQEAYLSPHPVLILGTAKWLFLPRNDFGTFIIDKENENGWKTISQPFVDLRFFVETLANRKNIRLIIGDSFLRTETSNRYKQGEIAEFESVKWRLPKDVFTKIIDLRKPVSKTLPTKQEKEFKTLSSEMLSLINETISKNTNMFIFAARKGLSSIIVCRDCGEPVKCFNCSSPMILYKTKIHSGRNNDVGGAFKCHQCGETRDAAEVCQNCRSWKLAAFGSGIDRVAEEIRKNIPEVNLFEIHKDITSTNIRALKIVESFYKNRGSILLGTEMAFPYIYKKVTSSAIASFDSLFSIPDFRIREKIFRLILQTKNLAKENFLIQTRNPNDDTIALAINGNLAEFYKKEIEDRQILDYPPFSVFIKITTRGSKNFVAKEIENLKTILKDYNPTIFNSVHEKRGAQSAINAVIKIPKEKWVDLNLFSILKSLPHHFEIKVDPDNLL